MDCVDYHIPPCQATRAKNSFIHFYIIRRCCEARKARMILLLFVDIYEYSLNLFLYNLTMKDIVSFKLSTFRILPTLLCPVSYTISERAEASKVARTVGTLKSSPSRLLSAQVRSTVSYFVDLSCRP